MGASMVIRNWNLNASYNFYNEQGLKVQQIFLTWQSVPPISSNDLSQNVLAWKVLLINWIQCIRSLLDYPSFLKLLIKSNSRIKILNLIKMRWFSTQLNSFWIQNCLLSWANWLLSFLWRSRIWIFKSFE
jgi:hypothetical protein